jgi:hypothetical protein
MGYRALQAVEAIGGSINAYEKFSNRDHLGGAMDLLGVLGSFMSLGRACFAGEMLLDVEGGKKRADTIKVGDRLWSKNEFDPTGPIELKEVEEVFVRVAPVVNVHVADQIIRTTAEHPFWVPTRGWIPAGMLAIGDMLTTRGGDLVPVKGVAEAAR